MFELIDVFIFNFAMHVLFNLVDELYALSYIYFLIMLIYHVLEVGIILASILFKHVQSTIDISGLSYKSCFFSFMDDVITFSGLEGVLKFATNWSYTCLDTFECESSMVSIVCHFLNGNSHFLSNPTQSSPYLVSS